MTRIERHHNIDARKTFRSELAAVGLGYAG
jgi:hypothetical protein